MGIAIFIFGLIIGSFLNALIWRLHTEDSVLRGRSYCPNCKHVLSCVELVPLVSFAVQQGKCRHCGKKISWQYPLVELATGLLFALAYYAMARHSSGASSDVFPPGIFTPMDVFLLFRNLFFIAALMVIFVYDLRWQIILDKVTLPAIGVAYLWNAFLGVSWYTMLVGAGVAGGFFLLQFAVSKGAWIGGGDIRLGALMGVMLGWQATLVALMIAYLSGSIVGIALILLRKKRGKDQIPFGTFLSIGTLIALLWGPQLVQWYLGVISI
ncbi:MAG: prepilin peptidase [Parcubacteria group bacterium CG08_land_8_20_14_0_20_48_21]|nr:MAG: hypothetical protein AUK21_00385 [Parcubacteria group bacterium CG2_30_48_51]PIS32713.1 MAG: prepilin peptidase [Parcubacteria group bacterium CG08_land_8_20_14_0_20_48_21]PIW79500.1 MAG: prepilin peptidase [Parcubacteria group bacterium CG_4_8_14_3_um_filter_48_16]PIY78270.1 MAG: prepilin peptidase [Parcubacteria group bacterium CG_4_10_14_0_8_um_filter_48_154]PIZ77390.1 MAG: prepilin peptidase [bacterium CG_4_10_14_0_2_um_filter_48_144]PJC39644.1 MAG: prepilin peptidase [Parcubacteri